MDRARGEVEELGANREEGRWLLVGLGKNAVGGRIYRNTEETEKRSKGDRIKGILIDTFYSD